MRLCRAERATRIRCQPVSTRSTEFGPIVTSGLARRREAFGVGQVDHDVGRRTDRPPRTCTCRSSACPGRPSGPSMPGDLAVREQIALRPDRGIRRAERIDRHVPECRRLSCRCARAPNVRSSFSVTPNVTSPNHASSSSHAFGQRVVADVEEPRVATACATACRAVGGLTASACCRPVKPFRFEQRRGLAHVLG